MARSSPDRDRQRTGRHLQAHDGERGGRKNPLPGGNEPFLCLRCGIQVEPLRNGTIRNHCPGCLWSLHVDRVPGDRAESCGGLMRPVGIEGSASRGWSIHFCCERCGAERRNRASTDDPVQPDRWDLLVALSTSARAAGDGRSQRKRIRQGPRMSQE